MQFIWFCAGGDSFFVGAGLMILAVAWSITKIGRRVAILIRASLVVGLTLILLAAMPFSPVFYAALVIGTILLVVLLGGKRLVAVRLAAQASIAAICVLTIVCELRFHTGVGALPGEPLYVIGDSVSAGIQGPNECPWPELLARYYDLEVISLAEPGATVASARKQAQRIADGPGLLFLEIGGNDLFAPTPPAQFEENLVQLLQQVVRPNRTVIMLELPVFPWDVRYGRIQRRSAQSFGVTVVPKRFLTRILRQKGSTLDLAHLSAQGHERMASQVAILLGLPEHKIKREGIRSTPDR